MATEYTMHPEFDNPPVNTQGSPALIARTVKIDWPLVTGDATYAFIINDTIKAMKIPAFVRLLGAALYNSVDLDDGTGVAELDVLITDGTTTKTLLDGGTATSAVGNVSSLDTHTVATDGIGFVTDNGDYYVYLKAIVAANGDAGSSAVSYLTVYYTPTIECFAGRDFPDPIPT
jgi:hypothetical protein